MVGRATQLLLTTCYIIANVHLNIRNTVSNKNEHYFVSMHTFNANTIHNYMQMKDFLIS